jgi:hypothetical protein
MKWICNGYKEDLIDAYPCLNDKDTTTLCMGDPCPTSTHTLQQLQQKGLIGLYRTVN